MAYRLTLYNHEIGTFDYDKTKDQFVYLNGDVGQVKIIIENFKRDRGIEVNALVVPRMKRDLYGMFTIEEVE